MLALLVFLLFDGLQTTPARVGAVTFPNSGAPAAQAAFLYGLAQLHNFEYADAARAFREAQQIDPGFAMAYWGEAMTANHPIWMEQDLGAARRILERLGPTSAARRAKAPTPRERDYLGAVEILFGAGDKHARDLRYRDEMRRLHAAYPDDVEATAFCALALLGSVADGRDTAVYMQAAAILEDVFATHADHPGIAHYLIHAYDDPAHAPLGLRAARQYSTIAPSAPHALHMTSHIYLATGMWDEVVAANEQAVRVASERARRAGINPGSCGHPNMWLMYGYLQQGRRKDARTILDGCRERATRDGGLVVRAAEQDPLDPDNIPAGSYTQMWSRYIIDTEEWSGDVAAQEIPLGDLAGARLTRAFVVALAAARSGDAARARTAQAALGDAHAKLKMVLAGRPQSEQYARRAAVLEQEIAALVLTAEARHDEAIATLRRAVADEQAMPVEFGPPFVDKPAAELLGELLLAAGRAGDAASAFESALRHAPNRATSLLGLARAASRAGRSDTAAASYAELRRIWHQADRVPDDVRTAERR